MVIDINLVHCVNFDNLDFHDIKIFCHTHFHGLNEIGNSKYFKVFFKKINLVIHFMNSHGLQNPLNINLSNIT